MSVCEACDTGPHVEVEESEHGDYVRFSDLPQWQPIETAPKDGTWILLTGGKICEHHVDEEHPLQPPCVVARWGHNEWSDKDWVVTEYDTGVCCVEYENPTHWMEVPK